MQIKYVVSSMIFWGREHPLSLEAECDLLKSLGFGIELWPNIKGQRECRYDKRNWPRLAAATEGMLVAMRSRQDNPALAQWGEQIECAKRLDAQIVTDLQSMGIPDEPELNGSGFAAEVVKMAEGKDVTLCLETGRLETLKALGKRFESIRYCLDTSYPCMGGPESSGFRRYVDDLCPKVAHLRLSDNYSSLGPRSGGAAGSLDESQITSHESRHFGFPGDSSAYQGLCRFWCGGGMPREDWDYLLESLNQYDNDVVCSIAMSPCMPAVMIRQASEFLFDTLQWPNRPLGQPGHANARRDST
ncbi:MAG: hypothetical protein A2Z25_12475 [Planctomycetes bacterium RBG_16_55_9]|nr:MAG: hypothetical protein A2Z25_12475 [Planctomycetes bacterium RBG_16_55_9]